MRLTPSFETQMRPSKSQSHVLRLTKIFDFKYSNHLRVSSVSRLVGMELQSLITEGHENNPSELRVKNDLFSRLSALWLFCI